MFVREAYKPSSVIGGHLSRPVVTSIDSTQDIKKQTIIETVPINSIHPQTYYTTLSRNSQMSGSLPFLQELYI